MGTSLTSKSARKYLHVGGLHKAPVGVSTRDTYCGATSDYAYRFPGCDQRGEGQMFAKLAAERDADGDSERDECSA